MAELFNHLIYATTIDHSTVIFRIVLSFFAGALIGFERETHRQPAGLRTHMLICMGSTIIMLLSIYIPQSYPQFQNGDPGRIAAQVVSGIGFIGAGAILRMGINVRGLTTAASIWAIAAIGLVIGAGMYITAAIAVVLILTVLIGVEQLEKHFFTPVNTKVLTIRTNNEQSDQRILSVLKNHKIRIIDTNPSYSKPSTYVYQYTITSRESTQWIKLNSDIAENDPRIVEIFISDPKT
ncbi:MAG: MgtC/SapB family protein [Prolixibacteraceae bacterium]